MKGKMASKVVAELKMSELSFHFFRNLKIVQDVKTVFKRGCLSSTGSDAHAR